MHTLQGLGRRHVSRRSFDKSFDFYTNKLGMPLDYTAGAAGLNYTQGKTPHPGREDEIREPGAPPPVRAEAPPRTP